MTADAVRLGAVHPHAADTVAEIADRLLRVLAQRLRRTDHDLSDLIFTDVPGRVAKHLLRLAQRFGVQQGTALRVDHGLSQLEIARLVGASRETVNKILTDFTDRGGIRVDGKSVLIAAPEPLVRRARRTSTPGPIEPGARTLPRHTSDGIPTAESRPGQVVSDYVAHPPDTTVPIVITDRSGERRA